MSTTDQTCAEADRDINLAAAVQLFIDNMDSWEPAVSDLVQTLIDNGDVSYRLSEAFDDYGQFCQGLARDICRACKDRGMPMAEGPDDIAEIPREPA